MKVKVIVDSGWSDCEECGSYDFEHVVVEKDGEVVLDHYGDSHLAGDMWYNWTDAVKEILTSLGVDVEVSE